MDNVAILNEVIAEVKAKKEVCLLYKIDFAKAYDSIDWDYLRSLMRRFNFSEK